jgi:integrase/recombinase XerD
VNLELISRTDLEAFIEYEQDRGLKPVSIRTRIGHLYAFIKYLIEQKTADYELLMYKIKVKQPDLLPRAIDPDDIKSLLSVLDGIRDRAMILLLLRTGMRIGELLNTQVRDIDLREQKILIYQADKTDVGRVVYFCKDAMDALTAWLNTRDFSKEILFYGRGCNSICYETARTIFHKNLKKADLLGKSYTLHCLRHTFASELLNSGMRLECLQVLMGHRTIDVTRRYARLTDKTREKEYFTAMEIIQRGEIDGNYQLDN